MKAHDAADPADQHNGAKHHTGKACITKGCSSPAGTWWSPYWCQPCNADRMARITKNLTDLANGT